MGDAKTALEYHLRALAIWQELQGEKHIDTALALDNVSGSYRSLGDMQLALEFAAKAFSVREEVLGLLHPDTASSLTQLGNIHGKAGGFDEALAYHRRALAIVDQLFGRRNIPRSFVVKNIGTVHFDRGHVGEALRNFEEALEIRRELFGDAHPETVVSVIDCAWSLCHLGRVHAGHQMTEDWLRKTAHGTPQHSRLKETQRDLQRKFPRPGFRQPPRSR